MNRNKNFWLYSAARLVSFTGTAMQTMVIPLYIIDKTGSGTLLGMFSIVTLLPLLIASPVSGIVGDNMNRKSIMVSMDLGRFMLVFMLALISSFSKTSIQIIFISQIFISIMDSFFNTSSSAFMPEIVQPENYMEACSIRGTIDGFTSLTGPVLGGILYGFFGIKAIFYINSISFLLSALASLLIKYQYARAAKRNIKINSFIKDNKEVLSFIKNHKGVLQLSIFALLVNFLASPMFDVLMPYVLKKVIGFSSQQFGYLSGFLTFGMIISNVAISLYFKYWSTKKLIKHGLTVTPFLHIVLAVLLYPLIVKYMGGASWYLFSAVSLVYMVIGFYNAMINTPISTNLQKLVPNYIRSRYSAIFGMFALGAIPLGSFIYGILIDILPYYIILISACLLSAAAFIIFLAVSCDEAFESKGEANNENADFETENTGTYTAR